MLVLSRQRDESIIIGDGENKITITVVDIRGDKVRLGIDAPTEIPVHRQEVYDAIQRDNQKATKLQPRDTHGLGHKAPPAPGPVPGAAPVEQPQTPPAAIT